MKEIKYLAGIALIGIALFFLYYFGSDMPLFTDDLSGIMLIAFIFITVILSYKWLTGE